MNILVTGGAGYIGSHTVVELIHDGHSVNVVDNLSNSSHESIKRVEQITDATVPLHVFDLQEKEKLANLFVDNKFDAVIHFAGLKAVGESVKNPLLYYRTNIDATLTLLEVMNESNVGTLIFSSSATVYGSSPIPYVETYPAGQGITNPYGETKYMIEQIIRDNAARQPQGHYTLLRYFNPVGAHPSGLIGEDPQGIPNNLMPFIAQVATGKRERLAIFGNDYDTRDGTCIRDYIHVVDLARGHVAALKQQANINEYNLGSGKGTSVLEMVNAFISATGQNIPYVFEARREGDLPAFYANAEKAKNELGWQTERSIEDMCRDTWNWQSQNPQGFDK